MKKLLSVFACIIILSSACRKTKDGVIETGSDERTLGDTIRADEPGGTPNPYSIEDTVNTTNTGIPDKD